MRAAGDAGGPAVLLVTSECCNGSQSQQQTVSARAEVCAVDMNTHIVRRNSCHSTNIDDHACKCNN